LPKPTTDNSQGTHTSPVPGSLSVGCCRMVPSVSRHKAALYRLKRCASCGPSPECDSLRECMIEGLRVASLALNVTRQLPIPKIGTLLIR